MPEWHGKARFIYGHIGTQCNASQVCGYCAGQHETKHCKQKGAEGFTPYCAACKGAHTAWSNACPARRKEMQRVERAKEVRSVYWHVPPKENTTQPPIAHMSQERQAQPRPIPAPTVARDPENATPAGTNAFERPNPGTPQDDTGSVDQLAEQTQLVQEPTGTGGSKETSAMPMPIALSDGEEWATPTVPQDRSGSPTRQTTLFHPRTRSTTPKHQKHKEQTTG